MPNFTPHWDILKSLRDGFLQEQFSNNSYWNNSETLVQYDATFAERIGWKWEAVLKEVLNKNLLAEKSSFQLVDWGCGTGIASRKFLGVLVTERVSEVLLVDRSPLAVSYAKEKILSEFPQLSVKTSLPKNLSPFILLISHVLNEISEKDKRDLMKLISKAELTFWVEPGTPKVSAQLIQIREELRNELTVIAPCPHQKSCGLLSTARKSDWCHFFAPAPPSVFQSSFWKRFSENLGIDLRALPTSFLVLSKGKEEAPHSSRVLGRPRHYKGYSLALLCNSKGVKEEKFLTRDQSDVVDLMKENRFTAFLP